jgi:uncharacterized damage-inducible protein DinB
MSRALIESYEKQLSEIHNGSPWIDETFKKKIESLTYEQAFAKSNPHIHSVAELVSHLVEWRKVAADALAGLPYESIFETPVNWRSNDVLRQTGWEKLQNEFDESHKRIISILEKQNDAWLGKVYQDGYNMKYLVEGLIHHDLYHLGQIGLTIKLLKK